MLLYVQLIPSLKCVERDQIVTLNQNHWNQLDSNPGSPGYEAAALSSVLSFPDVITKFSDDI